MTYKEFRDRIVNRLKSGEFIEDFSNYEPSSNKWEQYRQLKYWINGVEEQAEKNFREELLSLHEMDDMIKRMIELLVEESSITFTPFMKYRMQFVLLANAFGNEPDFDRTSRNSMPAAVKKLLPKDFSLHERFMENMKTIWADPRFWSIHHEVDDIPKGVELVTRYIEQHYGMEIRFPAVVWQQMVRKPFHRYYLWSLMCTMASCYFLLGSPYAKEAGIAESNRLDSAPYKQVLENYLKYPKSDLKGYLAAQGLPLYALKDLRDLGKQLNDNANWCLKTDNKYVAATARNIHRRQPTWYRAMKREKMVLLLKQQTNLAEKPAALARAHFGNAKDVELTQAMEAIDLFQKREYFDSENKYKGWTP